MFGGLAGTFPQETWAWDGINWTLLNPATKPSGRFYPTLTYDAARNQLMMFGGDVSGVGATHETWIWNGVNWAQQSPATIAFLRLYTAWFRCYLGNDQTACTVFRGASCGICADTNWATLDSKNL